MEPRYSPDGVEQRWQETWEEEGLYGADADDPRPTFVIAFPPPNVTGDLHMGHALQLALADALVRWRRMQGFNCLFQPGYDHAGIATQSVVEKELEKEGKSRHDLGREAFEARVWEWLRLYGRTIMMQFRRMGASMDYRRERFTMDDGYVRAVLKFFVHLWRRGWLYRDHRIVNWCPFHLSALSDLELDHVDVDDELVYVRYPLADGSGHVTIATVRPATILADVAVAVHPDDERYAGLIGKEVVVPFGERRVPVIADERVEPEFGTGALKVTPGHDPTDFEIGRAHGLPEPMVIGPDGLMSDDAGDLAGLDQKEAGKRVLAWCEERGLLEKREPYRHTIAVCERCESRIEPLISLQWWCRMDELGAPAIEALRTERVRYHPPSQHRFAIDSLEHAPDWSISRQLWWGHQLPVWYCPDGHVTVAETPPDACAECGRTDIARDPDVLDTWFSSALWPFATLGWPDDTPELRRFYPGRPQHHRARDHPSLGEPDDLLRARARRADPVLRRDHPFDGARARRPAHVEVARQRRRPAGGDRRVRRRRDPLRPHEDVLAAGHAALVRGDRRGSPPREQALERLAPRALGDGGGRRPTCGLATSRSAGSSRVWSRHVR